MLRGKKIWLLQTWEPNPLDDPNGRPWRTGMLARRLIQEGAEVTWWCSNFSHNFKRMRMTRPGKVQLDSSLIMRTIPALGYSKHVSIQRLKDHRFVARAWEKLASSSERPELIVASYPTIELCDVAVRWANKVGVPIMVDVRDQYPDLYWENASGLVRSAIKGLCAGSQSAARRVFAGATGVTANGEGVVDWALDYGQRTRGELDQAVYMSYEIPEFSIEQQDEAIRFWNDQLTKLSGPLIAYTGMIAQTIDLVAIRDAAHLLQRSGATIVLAGSGDKLEIAKTLFTGFDNVILPGWLDAPKVAELLKRADAGLMPYYERRNFETGVTNKPVEYMAYGLPILTSLQRGTIVEFLKQYSAGFSYLNGQPETLANLISRTDFKSFASNARRCFDENFHPDSVFGKWTQILEKCLENEKISALPGR